jgi:PKD repeat protein
MSATICSNGTFALIPANITNGRVPAGTTYSWPAPTITSGLTGGVAGSGATISGTLINTTNTVQVATYRVTPTSGSCTGALFTVIVTVDPEPSITPMSEIICSRGTFVSSPVNLTNGIVPSGTTYSWPAPSVTGGLTGGIGGSNSLNITGTFTNPTSSAQTATYLVTPISGICTGPTFTLTVTVNPLPVPTITGVATACVNSTGNIYTTESGMSNYIWSVSPGGVITAGGTGNETATISWTLAGTHSVSVNYTNGNGCTNTNATIYTVTVNPLPVAVLSGGETICPGLSSNLVVTLPLGTPPFELNIENYGTVTGYLSGTNIVVTPLSTTSYKLLSVKDANGCLVSFPSANLSGTATVVVNIIPAITSFIPSPPVCEFTLANFKVTASGTNPVYQWFVNEGSGFTPVTDGGTYYGATTPTLQILNTLRTLNGFIYHVVVSGCGKDVTSPDAVLTINIAPELTLHPSDSTICLGSNATMEADATGASVTWQWYVNKGSGFVLLNNDANFSGVTTKILTITNAPMTINNWIFRARATGICGLPVFTNFAKLSVTNNAIITVNPVPKVICENGNTVFLGNGTGYLGLQWQVFSGGVWTDIVDDAVYFGSGTPQLSILSAPVALNGNQYRLGLTGTCTAPYTTPATLTVNANPVVDFSAIDPVLACGGVPVVINGNPTGGSGTYAQHRWTGDVNLLNSTSIQAPTFKSQTSGDFNLNYKVTDNKGCTANDDLVVKVDSPSAFFTKDVDNGCSPLSVTITKDMTGIAKFWWNFNDGSPVDSVTTNPVHLFTNSSTTSIKYFTVKLTVLSPLGCSDTFTSVVTVYPMTDATFTPDKNIVCSGNAIIFTAMSGATKYFWDFGDGESRYATNVTSHIYTNLTTEPVVYQVKLATTSFYDCTDLKTYNITVMPVPLPQFTAVPPNQIYNPSGNPVTFTNTTNAGTWMWLWRFADGTTDTVKNPAHTYTALGEFNVTLIAGNANCSDSVKHKVGILPPPPVANFDSIPSGCSPLSVITNNTSLNTDVPGTTYKWEFGDGSSSTAKNPTYIYFDPGIYRIELTVTGPGGVSNKSQVVHVYPSPKAYFEISPTKVFVNDERVRCFNLSEGADSYLWEFGDGDTSKLKDPFHKYMSSGVFDITLWAFSDNGCSDKSILSPGVTVEPPGVVRFATVFTPNKDGPIELTELPTGGIEIDQFFFPPIREEVIEYKLQIFNRLGVLIFEAHDINKPWNGYYRGKLCPQGVYVWYVEGKYVNKQPFKMVGDVTLLH